MSRGPWPLAALALGCGLAFARPASAQISGTVSGTIAVVEHRVTTAAGVASAAGPTTGAGIALALSHRVEVDLSAAGGTLTPPGPGTGQQTFARADLGAALLPAPWLALGAGVTLLGFDDPVARQHWTATRLGAEVRLPFSVVPLTAVFRVALYPTVSATGLPAAQSAFGAGSGLAWDAGRLRVALSYSLERYNFAAAAAGPHREQLSTLTATVGLRFGRPGGAGDRGP